MLTTFSAPVDQPLRGRESEMARIHDVLEHGRAGGRAVVVIEGRPGSGKTRLMRECVTLADRLGYVTASSSRAGRAARPARETRHRLQAPGHREVPARHHGPVRPVLVLIDEFQGLTGWAERTAALPRGLRHDHVVWVAARRTGMGPDPTCVLLSDPTSRCERIALGPLAPSAALELAADTLGALPSPLLLRLVEQFQGHPRLIVELLAGMREERSIVVDGAEATLLTNRLPDRLRARVRRTLSQYSSECRQLLCVAAVLGTEVEYEALATMLRTAPSALLPVMEEACATGVLRHDGARTVFHNELVRQIIDDSVPAALKRALYREAALLRAVRQPPVDEPVRVPPPHPAAETPGHHPPPLSVRQHQLLRLVGEGLTNQQMARRLGLSPHTVNYHLRKLFKCFGVHSRIDLLRAAAGAHRALSLADSREL
ncbi:LuxR C-terminal-related transcriptional regulator [Streptomyces sp. NPDC020379]|uniref:helix-turn-helix transcriptional regulator n=1 Tax=Streptomyces sp. NPDC020379 TaxID=3365071 RepID=UPI0037B5FBF5